jgi:predicted nucleic acid-binding protein
MPAECFFDTSVLVYVLAHDGLRTPQAEELLADGGWISVQVLNELVAVATRKLRMPWKELKEATAAIRAVCEEPVPISLRLHERALELAQRYKYGFYDSLVIASALEVGCRVLYAEDMQDGQSIGGLRIRNPFKMRPAPHNPL